MKRLPPALATSLLLLAAFAPAAQAIPFGFTCVTNNSATNCGMGESQLALDVIEVSSTTVGFLFTNSGPQRSSVTDVYVDDEPVPHRNLLAITGLPDSGSGVAFAVGCSPGNLPGGSSIGFQTSFLLCADSNSPVQPNGVNPGEWLQVNLSYMPFVGFTDVIDAMNTGDLRVGIHVQGFAGGGSESLVTTPVTAVPEPATLLLLGVGLMAGGAGLRRRR